MARVRQEDASSTISGTKPKKDIDRIDDEIHRKGSIPSDSDKPKTVQAENRGVIKTLDDMSGMGGSTGSTGTMRRGEDMTRVDHTSNQKRGTVSGN